MKIESWNQNTGGYHGTAAEISGTLDGRGTRAIAQYHTNGTAIGTGDAAGTDAVVERRREIRHRHRGAGGVQAIDGSQHARTVGEGKPPGRLAAVGEQADAGCQTGRSAHRAGVQ